jgi:hypothetical protein
MVPAEEAGKEYSRMVVYMHALLKTAPMQNFGSELFSSEAPIRSAVFITRFDLWPVHLFLPDHSTTNMR